MAEVTNTSNALFDAIKANDLQAVQQALNEGVDPIAKDEDENSPLWEAIGQAKETGDIGIVKLLLEKGGPKLVTDEGDALLWHATDGPEESIKVMKLLLENKVNVDTQARDGGTALIRAVYQRDLEKTKLLLEHKANPNLQAVYSGAPLHCAAYEPNCEEIIDALLSNGADRNLKKYLNGTTPLHRAVEGRRLEHAKKLFKDNSDLNIMDDSQKTILHMAVQPDTTEFLDLFWGKETCSIDMNALTTEGRTPLFFAAGYGSLSCVKWLLDRGARVDIQDKFQTTPFLQCALGGNVETGKLLIEKSLSRSDMYTAIDKVGWGALHRAALGGHVEFTEWLLGKNREPSEGNLELSGGLDPNRPDKWGRTPLHVALDWQEPATPKVLLEFCRPGTFNKVDSDGNTPLHYALSKTPNEIELQNALMGKMSSSALIRKNGSGESALSLAAENAIKDDETLAINPLLSLFSRPLDVEHDRSTGWPTIFHSDGNHVEYIARKLEKVLSTTNPKQDHSISDSDM